MIITEQEAASLLKVTPAAMQRMRRVYGLPVMVAGRKYWYDLHELQDALKQVPDKPRPE